MGRVWHCLFAVLSLCSRAKFRLHAAEMNHSRLLTEPLLLSNTNCFGIKGKRCWPLLLPSEHQAAN